VGGNNFRNKVLDQSPPPGPSSTSAAQVEMGKAKTVTKRRKAAQSGPVSSGRGRLAGPSANRGRGDGLPTKLHARKEAALSRGQRKRAMRKENFRQKASFAAAMAGVDDPTAPKLNPYFGFKPVQGDRVGPISSAAQRALRHEAMKDFMQKMSSNWSEGQTTQEQSTKSAMQKPRQVRDGIEVEEVAQLKAVVSHATYQANPFMALQSHLNNTLPPPEAPKRIHPKKKNKNKKKSSGNRGRR